MMEEIMKMERTVKLGDLFVAFGVYLIFLVGGYWLAGFLFGSEIVTWTIIYHFFWMVTATGVPISFFFFKHRLVSLNSFFIKNWYQVKVVFLGIFSSWILAINFPPEGAQDGTLDLINLPPPFGFYFYFATIFFSPILEEVLFRGYFCEVIKELSNDLAALFGTVFFLLWHMFFFTFQGE